VANQYVSESGQVVLIDKDNHGHRYIVFSLHQLLLEAGRK